jgi:hypothetical protein
MTSAAPPAPPHDCPTAEAKVLPCDDCPLVAPITARMAKLDARLDRIEEALFGDSNGQRGIVRHVESLVEITRVGRSTFRVFMWIGAGVVGASATAWQLKQLLFGH